jgi:hypothetical protein
MRAREGRIVGMAAEDGRLGRLDRPGWLDWLDWHMGHLRET